MVRALAVSFLLGSILIGYLTKAQLFIPYGMWQSKNITLLTISDPVTYSYGTISTNLQAEKSFVVTNVGPYDATNLTAGTFGSTRFRWKGGTYPGTGGTCSTSLNVSQTCTVIVATSSTTATTQTDTVRIDYYNTFVSVSASRPVSATYTATPTRLKFTVGDAFVKVNDCVAITVESQDDLGNPVNVGANTTVTLTINNAVNTNFYTTNTCATTTTSRTINSGTSSVSFYMRSTTANQTGIKVATATGLTAAEDQFWVTNTPTRLYLIAAPQIKTNVCRPLTIRTVDANFFPANATGLININLTTSGANIYYSDSGCSASITTTTIAAGTFSRVIYTQNASVQTNTLTATDAGAVLTASSASVAFVASLTWWNTSWLKRIRIDINNVDQATTHTNMPVLVYLDSSIFSYSDVLANGADLRFVASDNSTVLPHQNDTWDPNATSLVWVGVNSITASSASTHIFMYYNNTSATDGQNAAGVWTNFWSVWHLNEDPVSTAPQYTDSIGSRNGSALNSPSRATGVIGYAANLPGGSDAVDVNSDMSGVLGASSTMSVWMKTTQTGNNTVWLAPGITGVEQSGGGNDIFYGWIDGGGLIGVTAGNGANAKSAFVVNDGAWRHVTMTRNSVSGQAIFYVNGVMSTSATSEVGLKTTAFELLGEIGDTGGTPVNFNGMIDEVRIYSNVQSAARIFGDFKYMMNTHLIYNTFEVQ